MTRPWHRVLPQVSLVMLKLLGMRHLSLLFFIPMLLSACASTSSSSSHSWTMQSNDEGSQARPEAYGADAYTINKEQPHRADPKPWEFYYKHCAVGGSDFYSAHAYDCSGPSF